MRLQSCVGAVLLSLGLISSQVMAASDVVDYIEAKQITNPPPSVPLNTFDRFEIAPIAMVAPYAGQDANEDAKKRLQTSLDEKVQSFLPQWNAAEAKNTPAKTLKIQPTIRHVKFIGGAARFWTGAAAGGSAVLMTVKLSDAATGEVIGEPEFYQHANKFGAAYSFGATDKNMLIREIELIAEYLRANYAAAVGGPTGKENPADKK
jgi:hypothetical protein